MLVLALSATFLTSPVFVPTAHAQSEDGDFEEGDEPKAKKKSRAAQAASAEDAGSIREINRGFYAKTSAGVATYLLNMGRSVSAGTNVTIAVGQDFVDTEKQSMAWELAIGQGVHNGAAWYDQAGYGCYTLGTGSEPCTEGDLRTYTVQVNYEISFYPVRRLGIGARVGGGVLYSPLLIEPTAYAEEVIPTFGADPQLHNSPKPIVFAGPTLEYYTKLSHFSLGIDIDVVYGIGWDLGLNGTGSLKYTF